MIAHGLSEDHSLDAGSRGGHVVTVLLIGRVIAPKPGNRLALCREINLVAQFRRLAANLLYKIERTRTAFINRRQRKLKAPQPFRLNGCTLCPPQLSSRTMNAPPQKNRWSLTRALIAGAATS
jgi:hypothetical protein